MIETPRYSVQEISNNTIRVNGGPDRNPVNVQFGNFIDVSKKGYLGVTEDEYRSWSKFSYTDLSGLCSLITFILTENWEPEYKEKTGYPYREALKKWLRNKVAPRVNQLVYPYVVKFRQESFWYPYQKNFFASTGKHLEYYHVCGPEGKEISDNYFLKDLLSYRSANHFLTLKDDPFYNQSNKPWRDQLSYTEKNYRSLNVTLDNWPYLMPVHAMKWVKNSVLFKPLLQREKLILYLTFVSHHTSLNRQQAFFNLLEKCDRDDLINSCQKTMDYHGIPEELFPQRLPIRTTWLNLVATLVKDYQGSFGTNRQSLTGLIEDSIQEHRRGYNLAGIRFNDTEKDFPLTLPSISLPNDERISLIKTKQELIQEGEKMNHCVSVYARDAKDGYYFIFHVDYEEESATVLVSDRGVVIQSLGPSNQVNAASEWSKYRLNKWGKDLRKSLFQTVQNLRENPITL